MYIKNLLPENINNTWQIMALCDNRKDCQVDGFLSTLPPNMEKDGVAMRRLIAYVSEHGTRDLPIEVCHNIADDVFQFSKGRIRVSWFYDNGKVIICCHASVKKKQKTPANVIAISVECMRSYKLAKAKSAIVELKEGE